MGRWGCLTASQRSKLRAGVCVPVCARLSVHSLCAWVCAFVCVAARPRDSGHRDPALSPSPGLGPELTHGEPELAGSHVGSPPRSPSCHCVPLPCFTLFGVLIPHPLASCLGSCCELLGPSPYPEPPHLGQGGVSAAGATVEVVVPEGLQGALGWAGTALSSIQAAAR